MRLLPRLPGKRVLVAANWSLQRARHGEQPYWAIIALAAILGQIGLPGGGFAFGYGSSNGMGNPRPDTPLYGLPIGINPVDIAIPVARVADLLLNPGETVRFDGRPITYPDIRLVYWAGGNPFHHHQDLNRLRQAFRRPATVIVNECYWTATARHADIVLPATTALERNDIGGCLEGSVSSGNAQTARACRRGAQRLLRSSPRLPSVWAREMLSRKAAARTTGCACLGGNLGRARPARHGRPFL